MSTKEMSYRQRQALECLELEGATGITARGFAEFANITRDSASGALNRLVAAGLARRESGVGVEPTRFFLQVLEDAPLATQAYDKGWMEGYEKGRVAGLAERLPAPDLVAVHNQGRAAGVVDGERRLGMDVLTLVTRMQQEMREGAPMHIHSKTCWKENAACALGSVRKLVERKTGLSVEEPALVVPYVEGTRKMARSRR